MYYLRSQSIQRADKVSHAVEQTKYEDTNNKQTEMFDEEESEDSKYDECLACQ